MILFLAISIVTTLYVISSILIRTRSRHVIKNYATRNHLTFLRDNCFNSLAVADGDSFTIQKNGHILCSLHFKPLNSNDVFIYNVCTASYARNRGCMTRLFDFAEIKWRGKYKRVLLDVSDSNDTAKQFYENKGFVVVSHTNDTHRMMKEIS